MTPMLIMGHKMNRMKQMVRTTTEGTFPLDSPFFMRKREEESLAPTTTSWRAANSSPMFLREVVSQALKIPPDDGEAKKMRWRGGVRPRRAPRRALRRGALIKL